MMNNEQAETFLRISGLIPTEILIALVQSAYRKGYQDCHRVDVKYMENTK